MIFCVVVLQNQKNVVPLQRQTAKRPSEAMRDDGKTW